MTKSLLALSLAFVFAATAGRWVACALFLGLPLAWYGLHRWGRERLRASLPFFWCVIALELLPLLLVKHLVLFGRGLVLPAGLSFLVFQAISFTADWRRRKIDELPPLADYLLFLLFFPKVLCGPLERFTDFRRQIAGARFLAPEHLGPAWRLLIVGVAKKVLVANYLGPLSAAYFDRPGPPGSFLEAFLVAHVFALEFYCDFSAYADLALGLGHVCGLRLTPNFRRPYLATSPQDFWQRWHVSLSAWFRDYVHFPLFFATKRLWLAVFATFFLMGAWHGLGWNYLALGLLWSVVMVTYSGTQPWRVEWAQRTAGRRGARAIERVLIIELVVFAFFLLRAAAPYAWQRLHWLEPWRWTALVEQASLRALFVAPLFALLEWAEAREVPWSWRQRIGFALVLLYYGLILFGFTEERGLTDVRFLYFQF